MRFQESALENAVYIIRILKAIRNAIGIIETREWNHALLTQKKG